MARKPLYSSELWPPNVLVRGLVRGSESGARATASKGRAKSPATEPAGRAGGALCARAISAGLYAGA
jgi:hypothetical protein